RGREELDVLTVPRPRRVVDEQHDAALRTVLERRRQEGPAYDSRILSIGRDEDGDCRNLRAMEKAMKLGSAGRSMAYQTAKIAEAGQLIHEAAVDQESNDGQERRLNDHGAPPVQRGGLDD